MVADVNEDAIDPRSSGSPRPDHAVVTDVNEDAIDDVFLAHAMNLLRPNH